MASFDVLKKTPTGLFASSRLNLTSALSKDMAPSFMRFNRMIFASSSNFKMAFLIVFSVVYASFVIDISLGIIQSCVSIMCWASS